MNGFEMILPFLKPIEHLILDDSVSEVMVNGPDRVFIEKQGFLQHVPGISIGERSLMVAVKNIARRLVTTFPNRSPFSTRGCPMAVESAIIPPCSLGGVTLTIRKFNSRHFEIEDLIGLGLSTEGSQTGWKTISCSGAITNFGERAPERRPP